VVLDGRLYFSVTITIKNIRQRERCRMLVGEMKQVQWMIPTLSLSDRWCERYQF
jgi:hypothetical protein